MSAMDIEDSTADSTTQLKKTDSETSQSKHDPGWNDPPTFRYDKAAEIQANASKKTVFNKRIAFPISTPAPNSPSTTTLNDPTTPISQNRPPPPPSVATTNTSSIAPNLSSNLEPKNEPDIDFNELLDNINRVRVDNEQSVTNRLNTMENLWRSGKLPKDVKIRLFELSKALVNENIESADHIQKSLMVDYISECSSWMGAIRQIINSKRK